jgi:hypothetical protein
MNAVIMFSADVFTLMGFENPFAPNIAFTALQVVGIVAGLALLDSRWGGRRIQLALVTATICPLLVLVGLSHQFGWSSDLNLVLMCLFAFSWQLAWGMIPWVYPSELFTMAERDRATSLAVFVQYAANAVLVVVAPELQIALGFAGMMWFFAAFNALNLVVIAACIKETKGIPLEEVPYLFAAPKGAGAKSACCADAPQADHSPAGAVDDVDDDDDSDASDSDSSDPAPASAAVCI